MIQPTILHDYIIQSPIGCGAFAKVFMAIHNQTGSRVAIKMISKSAEVQNGQYKPFIQKEVNIMKRVRHPYIADLYEVIQEGENIFIVMEYAHNGNLLNYINHYGPFKEEDAQPVFAQLVIVMKFLQLKCNVAHRDIKAENILFDINKNIRLIDFGLSKTPDTNQIMDTQCGSPSYASPELIMGQKYTFATDIWSMGVVLYAMMTGHLPFIETNFTRLAHMVIFKEIEFPPNISPNLSDILHRMLDKNPATRITIEELSMHPWIATHVAMYQDRIYRFKYDHRYIEQRMSLFGYKLDDIMNDIKNHQHTKATVSYEIVAREYMTNYFQTVVSSRKLSRHTRRYSTDQVDVLVTEIIKKEQANSIIQSAAKRKTMPIGTSPIIIHPKKKPTPIILL